MRLFLHDTKQNLPISNKKYKRATTISLQRSWNRLRAGLQRGWRAVPSHAGGTGLHRGWRAVPSHAGGIGLHRGWRAVPSHAGGTGLRRGWRAVPSHAGGTGQAAARALAAHLLWAAPEVPSQAAARMYSHFAATLHSPKRAWCADTNSSGVVSPVWTEQRFKPSLNPNFHQSSDSDSSWHSYQPHSWRRYPSIKKPPKPVVKVLKFVSEIRITLYQQKHFCLLLWLSVASTGTVTSGLVKLDLQSIPNGIKRITGISNIADLSCRPRISHHKVPVLNTAAITVGLVIISARIL